MYHPQIGMITLDMDCILILEAKGRSCNSLLTGLGVSQILVRFLQSLAQDRGLFRIMSKCRAQHLKKTTTNKPIQNSKFSNNSLSVNHQDIRCLSNKTDELLITVKNVHSPHILCLTEHHMKLPEILQVSYLL
jgi:hypothetical protein